MRFHLASATLHTQMNVDVAVVVTGDAKPFVPIFVAVTVSVVTICVNVAVMVCPRSVPVGSVKVNVAIVPAGLINALITSPVAVGVTAPPVSGVNVCASDWVAVTKAVVAS